MEIFRHWLQAVFSDTQLVILFLVLVVSCAIILSVGNLLAPVIASVVISFLLEGLVRFLVTFRWPRILAVGLVFGLFMLFLAVLVGCVTTYVENAATPSPETLTLCIENATAGYGNVNAKARMTN